ncbi:MAG TPA: PA14 domain-containing protein [Kiritimatiellia bacterium]|nr:PA14 domain-containing protein [Kiritimatiellia bacterium]
MKHLPLLGLVLTAWLAPAFQPLAAANPNDMMFTVQIRPWGVNSFDFTLENDSFERITGITIEMDGGTNNQKFSFIYANSLNPDARVLEPLYLQGNQGLVREVWNNISGNELNNLINNPRYPNSPDSRNILTGVFESPLNVADNYGQRIHGFLIPPVSGNYTFWLAGDDQSQLYLSTSDNPAGISPIATVVGWTGFREWTKYLAPFWPAPVGQRSSPIFLNANQPYYISALHKEGGGADHVSVGWTLPSGVFQGPIPGQNFRISTDNFSIPISDPSAGPQESTVIRLLDIAGLTLGESLSFAAAITPSPANAARVLWNNGLLRQNAKITVFGENGGRGELVIPDTLSNESGITYTFQTEKRPRRLKVASQVDGLGQYVSNYVFRVFNSQSSTPLMTFTNPSVSQTIENLSDGMRVEIEAAGEVFLSASGDFLYDSLNIPAEGQVDPLNPPRQRFLATGLSVNDSPQTGDPTQYSFTLNGDTEVTIRWRHDYALIVNHDFTATASPELDPNNQPWAGPLTSTASGNPSPDTTKIAWFAKGSEVIAQIDGQVVDNSRPGLNIRYVPKVYHARGSARGVFREFSVHTNDFQLGQSPPQRLQVNSFIMDGWGSIDYIWQIQFGIQVNVDDPARSALPRVFRVNRVNNQEVLIGALEGVFWFDPGEEVKIASAANVTTDPTSLALQGWVSGDGFYFGSAGRIATDTGEILAGFPAIPSQEPVAQWEPGFFDINGRLYRGLSIPVLRRPARVVWTYGNQTYRDTVYLGEYMFQNNQALLEADPQLASIILREPDQIILVEVTGENKNVAQSEMAIWDPNALRLYPLVPGKFEAVWQISDEASIRVFVDALVPPQPHYPHIANTPPVQLTPDPNGTFSFKELKYTETDAAISGGSLFTATKPGLSVLLFGEIKQIGRGEAKEFLRVRMVETRAWDDDLAPEATVIIGQPIRDPALDRANLGTGYLLFEQARYNPNIYDASALNGIVSRAIYDMPLLRSTLAEKRVINRGALPGPIIPVNLHPGAAPNQRIVIVWYYDPTLTDEILWPYQARSYRPRWPVNELEGLGRIVIASQFGSDSVGTTGANQLVAPAVTNITSDGLGGSITSIIAAATTYDPSRIQGPIIYNQPNSALPGYNPNEEHALLAPSRRFAQVSPRPPAAYALRDRDLNRYSPNQSGESGQPSDYTSHPYVLVQFFDTAVNDFRMRVYRIQREDPNFPNYAFANQGKITIPAGATQVPASPVSLAQEPFVRMEAGEPVIPFYPLGVVMGASPPPESFGINIKNQSTFWKDHKSTSWAVSGGENAWFTFSIYYPMAPDFWWPPGKPGRFVFDPATSNRLARFPNTGDSVAFMPNNISLLLNQSSNAVLSATIISNAQPNRILYKSDWPAVAPILKAGETLTFSGGEFRADNPTSLTIDQNGNLQTVATPGLPGVLGFAVGEVVFDALNPQGRASELTNRWTARMGQVLDVRTVNLPIGSFPSRLQPANGLTRVSGGKYVFNELPASLQKRFRYDPLATSVDTNTGLTVNGRLEITGIINDKGIGSPTLTAPPPAVYVLEPNIMTVADRDALLALSSETAWQAAVQALFHKTRNPEGLRNSNNQLITGQYLVGLQPRVRRDPVTGLPLLTPIEPGSTVLVPSTDPREVEAARQFGPGLALIPNAGFLNPLGTYLAPNGSNMPFPDVSWITVAENNDPSMGGSPVTLHVIKVDRRERYRGAIKTVLSDNVFDENVVLRHTGDFGANADDLVFEWWYRPDDGALNVMPPYIVNRDLAGPWALFPDLTGNQGLGRNEVLLKGNPNAPETLLADSWWFTRYRHKNDVADDTDWYKPQPDGDAQVNFEWAGAGNNDPFNDFDLDGFPDYRAQLSMGWIKRVLDAVNPYEARIRDFEGDSPSTVSSMLQQLGPRYEGPVALNPDKNVIENVGLIELYETILNRASDLSINLSSPVSTPAIANALQLASTRLSDFYTLLGNEAYSDAKDPTIGIGSSSIEFGSLAPVVFSFQNQLSSLIEEELALLRGADDFFARPVYNRLFWNFTKGEGEAAYVMNYNISDINADGFIDEDDAMILYPQGHGDAWGHYLTALRKQYDLLRHPFFNWVSRSEFYNLMDIVLKVDFLDERKFAQVAAAKARAGYEILTVTYRNHYVEDPTAQWQGYTDVNPDRAWGVQDWARRAGQGAYFDWITANALLPSQHPNQTLEGIQKVDRESNADIKVVSANLNSIQRTFDDANQGLNPLRISSQAVPFDVSPEMMDDLVFGRSYFEQIYDRAMIALNNALAVWEHANESQNRIRQIAVTEDEFRNDVFQEDLAYRNALIEIFGRPYDGTVGPGRLYPAGYNGPDLALYMYVNVREISNQTVPGPTLDFATFNAAGTLTGGDILSAYNGQSGRSITRLGESMRRDFAPSFVPDANTGVTPILARDGWYAVNYTDLSDPKVPLDNFTQLMPVKASGYTFQAPSAWGSRPAVGELQVIINEMIQQEADLIAAIGAWDGLSGSIIRTMRSINSQLDVQQQIMLEKEIYTRIKYVTLNILKGIATAIDIAEDAKDTALTFGQATSEFVPKNLPTAGLAFSPGDALSAVRGGAMLAAGTIETGISVAQQVSRALLLAGEIAFDIVDAELQLFEERLERRLAQEELIRSLEDMIGDEPVLRIAIFKEIEALRALSERYRSTVAAGARLIDERAAFNKRVAAMTQMNRYQDMTFRVHRNHALQNYNAMFDVAARYAYLAAKAYDYETNLDPSDPASPSSLFAEIIRARTLGLVVDGEPQMGADGLAGVLARLRINYEALKGQLGFNNPQTETGKLSLRTELFRILPSGETQPDGYPGFPGAGEDSDTLWQQTLENARVDNLWDVPEYRYLARPFASDIAANGNAAVEPGIVLRFGTTITAGQNVFGRPLSGGDHAYDPSVFATKVRSVGVWFSDYLSDDVLNDLPKTPRVYLIPVGMDIMSVANAITPDKIRTWKVVDQQVPTPLPSLTSSLDKSRFIPLLDTLNGRIGAPRRYSSFRAYHNAESEVDEDELVFDSRLIGRSVWNTEWMLIIPGLTLNSDPDEGLDRFIDQVTDIKLVFQTYGHSGN